MLNVRDKTGLTALDRLIEKLPESAMVSTGQWGQTTVTPSLYIIYNTIENTIHKIQLKRV